MVLLVILCIVGARFGCADAALGKSVEEDARPVGHKAEQQEDAQLSQHRECFAQRQGIASRLVKQCLADLKAQGIVGFHLITAREGALPAFYERFSFKKEERVMLMGKE